MSDGVWHRANGDIVEYDDIIKKLKVHTSKNGGVYIGTDSHLATDKFIFATVICLHNPIEKSGGTYYFQREYIKPGKFGSLVNRILHEVNLSINIGLLLREANIKNIELHIDASGPDAGNATSKFSNMLVGFAKGAGFDFKIKPDAWSSSSIADKHAK